MKGWGNWAQIRRQKKHVPILIYFLYITDNLHTIDKYSILYVKKNEYLYFRLHLSLKKLYTADSLDFFMKIKIK